MAEARRLPDWNAVCAYIGETYEELSEFTKEFIRFRVRRDDQTTWIKARVLQGLDPEWVFFLTKVCPEAQIEPRAVLHRSSITVIGELSLFGDFVVLGQRLPLVGLDTAVLTTIIDALVTERALIIKELVKDEGNEKQAEAFSHFTE